MNRRSDTLGFLRAWGMPRIEVSTEFDDEHDLQFLRLSLVAVFFGRTRVLRLPILIGVPVGQDIVGKEVPALPRGAGVRMSMGAVGLGIRAFGSIFRARKR